MVFQEQSLVPNLTVAENIVLGSEGAGVRAGVYRWDRCAVRPRSSWTRSGRPSTRRPQETLTFAERQMVEIAKALADRGAHDGPAVIILDEPTSVLERRRSRCCSPQIGRLRQFASVVFVSHRLDEVLDVCDRVSVLRGGQSVGEVRRRRARPRRPARR